MGDERYCITGNFVYYSFSPITLRVVKEIIIDCICGLDRGNKKFMQHFDGETCPLARPRRWEDNIKMNLR
jgi:hypothetical protein